MNVRLIGPLLGVAALAGCLTSGGGGGGDCRDGDEACSAGFACVAVANGTAYACRAACDGPDDCLRDEICGADGICVDRPPRQPPEDAEVLQPSVDAAVDMTVIRFVDAEPDAAPPADADIVIVVPPDAAPDPGRCQEAAPPAERLVLGLRLTIAQRSPMYFGVESVPEGEGFSLIVEPLTVAARRPTGVVVQTPRFETDGDGRFTSPPFEVPVPPSANDLGGALLMRIALTGTVRGDGSLCGVVEGELVQPAAGDISGSTFSARATADLRLDPWPACEGCLP